MHRIPLLFALSLSACTSFSSFPGGLSTPPQERGALEVLVTTEIGAIITDIQSGGGPALTRAFDTANVPAEDRATRAFQLNTDLPLYAGNPGALVTVLDLYGRSGS